MGSAINPNEIKRFETTEIYSHPDAKVDIVLVHGLNGDPQRTWTAKNGVFWPIDLLPVTLKSVTARILVYGYNADVWAFGSGKSASSDLIHQHAQSLVSNLALERKSEEVADHPIIWVAHSLGGILVKRALELSNDLTSKNADDNRSIFVSTFGIIFLGTPHTGADPAKWGLILQGMVDALVPKKFMDTEAQLVRTLTTNNETLQNINLHFLDIYQRFKICMVHESVKTDLKGTRSFIVDQASAGPLLPDVQYFGIEASHSDMCKFESKNSPGYLSVSTTIKGWVQECPPIIQARWDMERRQRRQMKEAQAAELLNIFPSTQPVTPKVSTTANTPDPSSVNNSTIIFKPTLSIDPEDPDTETAPYFIKPSGFRPNSLFVGRQSELSEIHKMLFDKKQRAEGTSAVLIQSMPGGGKTHLARQYVYEHKDDYPGGIFWLRAKSQSELAAGFWDIARKAALRPSMANEDSKSLEDPQQFIKLVKKWLNHRHDWLMVLDGIHFDDPEGLRRFIPDSKDTGLIYTSTEKSASGNYLFMNPQIVKLPLLSAREAQQLLLLELDRREPFSKDDLKNSMELVQAMGLLPVVIHAVAQRLKATDEPLSKFARSYASEPKLRGLGAYVAVVDQLKVLGAYEALNLVNILCFFSQHIPVEMISLGLKALDVPVKASEPVTGRSLNNTFKILNMFALVDRNEQDAPLESSQSSKTSRDMLADNVDVIRLHSVVQAFFADTLLAAGTVPMWLDRAIRVFCCSYDTANERIIRKTHAGLVEDYRLYEIHGIKLREHVTRAIKHEKNGGTLRTLQVTHEALEERLRAIQNEIERRTPESSHVICGGRPDAFQTSIFDRTSSSSDTGPETPGLYDDLRSKSHSKSRSGVTTWGLEMEKAQTDSPTSITYNTGYEIYDTDRIQRLEALSKSYFPPLAASEDAGYDSDREGSAAMTMQPSQRTLHQDSSLSPGGKWETVKPRRPKNRPARLRLDPHRTIKTMEKQRYRDSAGAYRAISAIDPRVSHETAQGYLHRSSSRAQSRGRMSGQSVAEVALTHITKNSPPPARGGGMIRDRSSSVRGGERPRMVAGTASYAAAVSGLKRDSIPGFREPVRLATEPQQSSTDSSSTLENRPQSSAMVSLQRFPITVVTHPPSTPHTPAFTPMPPYPPSPSLSYRQPYPTSDTYQIPGRYSQENLSLGPDPYPSNIYPRMTGTVPFESHPTALASSASSPRKRDLPHDYPAWHSQTYSESMPSSMHMHQQNPPFLSLSSPNIQREHSGPYCPGHPEFSVPSNHDGGYTSQPMSRDHSGQSEHSNRSTSAADRNRRRPSLAETEPLPQLPIFSPRIPPTSYQVYERMRESERDVNRDRDRGAVRKSPRLDFARVDDWEFLPQENTPPPRRAFNPAAPSFSPSRTSPNFYPNQNRSPNLPPVPPNSLFSNPSTLPSQTTSRDASQYPSPMPLQAPNTTPQSFAAGDAFPASGLREDGRYAEQVRFEAPEMGRTTSGGMRIGRRVIEFGDFPEPVDADLARERVERSWEERERGRDRRRVEGLGLGVGDWGGEEVV